MHRFPCPFLGSEVELGSEREAHIAGRHPDLLPEHRQRIGETLSDPDEIRRSRRFADALVFSRWYDDVRDGKHVVVVVVTSSERGRNWIITAYLARTLVSGVTQWQRS